VSSSITPPLARALKRIFKIADVDADGRLSDAELCAYQRRTYGNSLVPLECTGLMEILLDSGPSYADASGVMLEGFLYLHKLLIQGSRQESVWFALAAHGYAAPPSLYLLPASIPQLSELPSAPLLPSFTPGTTWTPLHTNWRVSGSHRCVPTLEAVRFVNASLGLDADLSDAGLVAPSRVALFLEVPYLHFNALRFPHASAFRMPQLLLHSPAAKSSEHRQPTAPLHRSLQQLSLQPHSTHRA
jgi:hypothetical protein